MWNNIVAFGERVLHQVAARCFEGFTLHPVVGAGLLAVLFVLSAMLWIEALKDSLDLEETRDSWQDDRPMRLRR